MEKYLFKSNIFAQLSEIVEADSEKEVWNKIRNRTSFEIKQKALQVYPASIEIRKIKEKKEKNNMELKETVELMNSEDYKERFVAEYRQVKIRYEKLKNFCNKIEVETMLGKEVTKHDCPLELLREQQKYMGLYLSVLEKRALIENVELNEKQMTSTELIKDMLERQKAYDEEVFKKHNVDYVSKTQLESALFDELGELMHAQKSDWCWWKFTQEPKDEAKVFEEYIDVVHFALMYEIKFGSGCYQYEDIKWNYNKLKTDLGFGQAYAFSCVISLTRDDNVLAYVIALGLHLGYSFGEIYNEYIRKNEINKERLAKGY